MNYDLFIKMLEDYVASKIDEAHVLYDGDDKTISYVETILKQKLNHTKRVVDFVVELAKKINMQINYEKIVFASGLFHDIGRFNQGLMFRNYNDSQVFPVGRNHGDYGYELIKTSPQEIHIFDEIVEDKAKPAVATSVRLHQRGILPERFDKHIDDSLRKADPNSILTGSYNFNEYEEKIISALLHMVRDADRIDILWQRARGEIVPVSDTVYLKNTGNVNEMANRWGVSKDVILANNDEERLATNSHIKMPREKIPIEKLFINPELMKKMQNFEHIDLRELQGEDDYTFITALYWSVYTFLKDMNFVGNLEQVKERQLLDQIYNQYPKEYHPLLDELIKFAKDTLIDEQIAKSKDSLYVKRSR